MQWMTTFLPERSSVTICPTSSANFSAEVRFFEYKSRGPGAVMSAARRQLTARQAAAFEPAKVLGGWRP